MICTIEAFKTLKQTKSATQRLMGIDLGDKTMGISLSDLTLTIATPHQTIQRKGFKSDAQDLIKIINQFNIFAIVIGYPINMNGSLGPQSEKVLSFCNKLLEIIEVPILLWDERLSTMAVHRTLIAADVSRKKQKSAIDKMAASFILQGAIDYLKINQ